LKKTPLYQEFNSYNNNLFFYLHTAVLAFILSEMHPEETVIALVFSTVCFAVVLYTTFETIHYDHKLMELEERLRKANKWVEPEITTGVKTFRSLVKVYCSENPRSIQSFVGIGIFTLYLFLSNVLSLPSTLLGFFLFFGFFAVVFVLVIIPPSVKHLSDSQTTNALKKILMPTRHVGFALKLFGRSPLLFIIIHLLFGFFTNPDFSFENSTLENNEPHILLYLGFVSKSFFSRMEQKNVLKNLYVQDLSEKGIND